jgi:hypothetical protein
MRTAIVAAIAFCAAMAITSGYGPGLDPDSMAHVGAATSLARHGTLRVPSSRWQSIDSTVALTVWPPAFPIAMAVPQRLGASPLNSARIVIALSAAATAAIAFILLSAATSIPIAALGVIAILVTPSFVTVHISVLSEPLFLAMLMLTLFGMIRGRPLFAGISAAAALMTRYAGACAGWAVALWFLLDARATTKEKIRGAAIGIAPSVTAGLIWMIRSSQVQAPQASIKLSYYGGIFATVKEGLETLTSLFAPGLEGATAFIVAGLVALGLAYAFVIAHRRTTSANSDRDKKLVALFRSGGLLLACYALVLVCSRLFVGGAIRFDARLLSPAILLLEIAVILAVSGVLASADRNRRIIARVLVGGWVLASLAVDAPVIEDSITDGNDFASSDWRESPAIGWVKNGADGRTLYTNWPAAIYFGSGRTSHDIPNTMNADTLHLFNSIFARQHGAFVAFDSRNSDYPPSDSIAAAIGLVAARRFPDATVWIAPPSH